MLLSKLKFCKFLLIGLCVTNNVFLAQLRANSNQADYLIITPSEFVSTLEKFAEWRRQKGFNLKIIELEQIYNEFSDSTRSSAIRNFVSYTLTYWDNPKPQNILLVGGTRLLPSYRVLSMFSNTPDLDEDSVSIDEWYAVNLYEPDMKPDVCLGRFPVNNQQELKNTINKTMFFEDSLLFENYPINMLFLADNANSGYFENKTNKFINTYLPPEFTYNTIFASQDSSIKVTRENLFNGLNKGTLFLDYSGEGLPEFWSRHNIFTTVDIDSLEENNLYFVYTTATCKQSFDSQNDSSIVGKFITTHRKGSVASITPTGLIYLTENDFITIYYRQLFNNPEQSIGFAFLQAKLYPNNPIYSEHPAGYQRKFTLLGDPALKIPLGVLSNLSNEQITLPNYYLLEQNYPNPFNPTTVINYSIYKTGFVTIKIYDSLGQQVEILVNEVKQPGYYNIKFDGLNLSSGIYMYQMRVNDFIDTKKLVLIR